MKLDQDGVQKLELGEFGEQTNLRSSWEIHTLAPSSECSSISMMFISMICGGVLSKVGGLKIQKEM